jgi:hypothetical protein
MKIFEHTNVPDKLEQARARLKILASPLRSIEQSGEGFFCSGQISYCSSMIFSIQAENGRDEQTVQDKSNFQ